MTVGRGEACGKSEAIRPRSRPRWSERSAASRDIHALASVEGDGAVWPKCRTGSVLSVPNPSSAKACRVGGLDRPFLLVPSLWASKEKGLGRRQASESPLQASNLATRPIQKNDEGHRKTRPSSQPSPRRGEGAKSRSLPSHGDSLRSKASPVAITPNEKTRLIDPARSRYAVPPHDDPCRARGFPDPAGSSLPATATATRVPCRSSAGNPCR